MWVGGLLDSIDRAEQRFQKINRELTEILELVENFPKYPEQCNAHHAKAMQEMQKLVDSMGQIGGKLREEAIRLQANLQAFFKHPSEEMRLQIMQSALHIKHEVREI